MPFHYIAFSTVDTKKMQTYFTPVGQRKDEGILNSMDNKGLQSGTIEKKKKNLAKQ